MSTSFCFLTSSRAFFSAVFKNWRNHDHEAHFKHCVSDKSVSGCVTQPCGKSQVWTEISYYQPTVQSRHFSSPCETRNSAIREIGAKIMPWLDWGESQDSVVNLKSVFLVIYFGYDKSIKLLARQVIIIWWYSSLPFQKAIAHFEINIPNPLKGSQFLLGGE